MAACVNEAATEGLPVKQAIFRELEGVLGGEAILATNTPSISIRKLAARGVWQRRGRWTRCFGWAWRTP